jgi:hypothetical protein
MPATISRLTMNFYCISRIDTGAFKYAWSSGYGPVNHMPFFEYFSEDWKRTKSASWNQNNDEPGINIDRGGQEWSDILGCGGGPPSEFFSERVIEDLRNEGIPFLRCTEMPLGKVNSNRLREIPPPKYFVLEAEPGMRIRSVSVPIEEQIAARSERPPRWISPCRTIGTLSSWDGADLFSPAHGYSLTALFCTERVKELAERKGWTNIEFKPLKVV